MSCGQNSLMPQFGREGSKGSKTKIYPSFSQSIENQKLYKLYINQPPKSIRERDMGVSPFFDLKKVLFLCYLPSKLGWKFEIRYVHLVGALGAFWGSRLFSPTLTPLSPKEVIF